MVNNAGVGIEGVPIHELSEDRWESVMYVFPLLGNPIASGGCCFLFHISLKLDSGYFQSVGANNC